MKTHDEKLALARKAAERLVAHNRVASHVDPTLIAHILACNSFWIVECYLVAEFEVEVLRAEVAELRRLVESDKEAKQ